MDIQAINEVNIVLEYMQDSDILSVTTVEEKLTIKKSKGNFYIDTLKFNKPPSLNAFGSLIYFPPSLSGNMYVQTKQVLELKLNDKTIYNVK